jgi:radical SAM superfamily enzyme YgiQ (UPF0313 family)
MGIKVLFVYPNTFGMNMLPPAIALFSALLKREGHQTEIFDATYYQTDYGIDSDGSKAEHLNVVPYDMGRRGISMRTSDWQEDIRAQVRSFNPDLIAVSSTEDMYELGVQLLEEIEGYIIQHGVPVIVGGVFATFAPELVLRHRLVDMVCVGEGEHALIDLCDRIERGKSYDDVTNLWLKQPDGSIRRNLVTDPVDVNENPMLDIGLFEEARLYRPMAGRVYRMLPVETARGCPFTCRFCNSPDQMRLYEENTNASFFRKKRMDLVYKELLYFKEELGVEYNYFWADTFLAMNMTEFEEFCEMYSEIRLPFWMQTRPETVTDYKIRKLASVGLHRISFGIEHGNEDFRTRIIDRRWKNDDIVEALKIPHRYDVQFSVNNITGFPTETRRLALDTVELNRRIGADNHNIYSFTPFHGTPLRQMCEDMGLIHPDTITKCLTDKPALALEDYPAAEIEGLKKCFVLYVRLARDRWPAIQQAEANTAEGNKIFEDLRGEYMERHFSASKDNPNAEMPNTADLEYGLT